MAVKNTNHTYFVKGQYPLDIKHFYSTREELIASISDNATSFYDGMIVYVAENNSYWMWREYFVDENVSWLLDDGYTYPTCWRDDKVDYSGKTYNFIRVYFENDFYPGDSSDPSIPGLIFLDTIDDLRDYSISISEGKQLGVKNYDSEEAYLIYQYCSTCTDSDNGYDVIDSYNGIGRWILQTRLKYADRVDNLETRDEAEGQTPYIPIADGSSNPGLDSDTLDSYHAGNSSGQIPVSNGNLNIDLNADKLDGYDAGHNSGQIPISDGNINTNLNADLLDGFNAGNASGNIPINNGQKNYNLYADILDSFHASSVPQASTIPASKANGKLDNGWLNASVSSVPNNIPLGDSSGKIDNSWLNMGDGGGINADMLDGKHANEFLFIRSSSSVVDVSTEGGKSKIFFSYRLQYPVAVRFRFTGLLSVKYKSITGEVNIATYFVKGNLGVKDGYPSDSGDNYTAVGELSIYGSSDTLVPIYTVGFLNRYNDNVVSFGIYLLPDLSNYTDVYVWFGLISFEGYDIDSYLTFYEDPLSPSLSSSAYFSRAFSNNSSATSISSGLFYGTYQKTGAGATDYTTTSGYRHFQYGNDFYVKGNVVANGTTLSSDIRLKSNVYELDINKLLSDLESLPPAVEFVDSQGQKRIGYISNLMPSTFTNRIGSTVYIDTFAVTTAIAEGLRDVRKAAKNLAESFADFTDSITNKIQQIEERLNRIEGRLDKLESDLSRTIKF